MKYKEGKYQELLDIAINRAYKSFENFLSLFDINKEDFEDLFNINISIDNNNYCKDNEYAITLNDINPHIYISLSYLNNLIDNFNNDSCRQTAINSLSITIVHELLLINRNIFNKKENINNIEYDTLLQETINNGSYNFFDSIVPLCTKMNEDRTYNVVCYDKKDNSYLFFNNQEFFSLNNKPFPLISIGIELNTPSLNHLESYRINLNRELNSDQNEISIEEMIIEVISHIVIKTRKNNILNLNTLNDYFNTNFNKEIKLLFNIIKKSGNNFIKIFLLSSRNINDYFDDDTYRLYNDKYNSILKLFDKIRSGNKNNIDINNIYRR